MKNLVIVESPAKAKTIEKFLGPDFKVMSSRGHIRDLRSKDFSIDVDNGFAPIYEISADKKQLVNELKAAAAKADTVWLASDEDREGEAIAWHLSEVLGLDPAKTRRIVFHEITKPAILAAIENPRTIDMDRVNAQQARRVLDRIVGFELSPVLWKKIKPMLSAGRVQSVAVRLICEREKEIRNFKGEPFFRINANFSNAAGSLKAELDKRLRTRSDAEAFLRACSDATFSVADVAIKPLKRSPAPPFSTSTLQQEAARRLGFTVTQTMMVAQKLYEAGLITYMRTDSLNLSKLALADIAKEIKKEMGESYHKARNYHTHSKGAQEAHEAIRPTYISNSTIEGTQQEKRLYDLIRKRTLASQMADAELEKTTVDIAISNRDEKFVATGEVVKFDGFMRVYHSEDSADTSHIPPMEKGMQLTPGDITATQRTTLSPARYNEASLVKKLEELGIGRPSTYAPTISTIQAKDYVKRGEKESTPHKYEVLILKPGEKNPVSDMLTEMSGSDKGRLVPTDVGMIVNDFLTEYFPDILDYGFTARIEEKFDEIAGGGLKWQNEISDFYDSFHPNIERVGDLRMKQRVGERLIGTDPKTGKPVSVKIGRYGPVVQLGAPGEEEKPLFASLLKGQTMDSLTLEEALKLFELPRTLGELEGNAVTAAIGRFGPYVKSGSMFVSIPSGESPMTITFERAIELINAKKEADANKHIKTFDEMPGLEVLNGRFGPYLSYKPQGAKKAENYHLPKDIDPASLTLEKAQEIMKSQDEAPAAKRAPRRRSAKKK